MFSTRNMKSKEAIRWGNKHVFFHYYSSGEGDNRIETSLQEAFKIGDPRILVDV